MGCSASCRDAGGPAKSSLYRAVNVYIVPRSWGFEAGLLFVAQGYGRGSVSKETYARVWRAAQKAALTSAQQRTPLGRVPYQLRHAAVSLWLTAGVPATQVAEWAGHSVHVLLKVYAKCIEGQDEAARRRIQEALGDVDDQGDAA